MDHHPSASDFDRLLRGQLSHTERRALVVHLLRGCPTCAALFSPELVSGDADYDALFERLSRPQSRLSQALENPPSLLWAELEPLTREQRRLSLQKRRYRSPTFVSWLTRHSRTLAAMDAPSALLAAELALCLVDQLDLSDLAGDLVCDLRASALAHLGNALRCLGRFAEGLKAFREAERELSASADRLTRAEFLSLRAGLYKDVGRFLEAANDLRTAYRFGANVADSHTRGRILLQLAEVVGVENPAGGLEILTEAAAKIDPLREPRLQLILSHRRAWFLNDAGRPALAMEVLRATWPLYGRSPEPHVRGLRTWLWGRIERSFGEARQAEIYLSRAVDLFLELDAARDHAVSGLDLADIYLRLGQPQKARRLLLASRDFLEQHLHDQAWELWLSLADGPLTLALLIEATAYFKRFWNVPCESAA